MPKIVYSGQKLINEVSRKTTANISSIVPSNPEITPVKKSTATITAIIILSILSAEPIFFFIKTPLKKLIII